MRAGIDDDIPADPSTLIRLGTVVEVTLSPPRCRVRYGDPDADEEETETPPIRWLAGRAGRTRKWSPPSVGEEVVLLSPDGQVGNAIAVTGLVNDEYPAPSDEDIELMLFEDGARIAYDPLAHALTAILPGGATALIEADGGVTIRGDVTIEGNVTVQGGVEATEDVKAGAISLKTHKHGGVSAGMAQTAAPV